MHPNLLQKAHAKMTPKQRKEIKAILAMNVCDSCGKSIVGEYCYECEQKFDYKN